MWVQLKSIKRIEVQGKLRTYKQGDWVDVGKQTALLWISEGSAWIPEGAAVDLMGADCGVFLFGEYTPEQMSGVLGDYAGKVEAQCGLWPDDPSTGSGQGLPWSKTLLYNPLLRMRKELTPVGFHLLDTWQVVAPLWYYDKLAADQGTDEDRELTAAVCHDLRVPLYSPDLVFVRRCGDTERFVADWGADDRKNGGDRRFSLLRALYRCKPLVLAVPTTWIGKDRGA